MTLRRLFLFALICFATADAGRRRTRKGDKHRPEKTFSRRACSSDPQPCYESELDDLGRRIWREDANRVLPGTGYRLNMQANAGYNGIDYAPWPLFSWVDSTVLQKPTVKAMVALFDNYKRYLGSSEYESNGEKRENWNFINSVINTRPMQLVYQFLLRKKIVCSLTHFKSRLYHIWFKMYARRSSSGYDSSGFEHVFVGETDNYKVLGLHNWIQFYLQERRRNIDYKGYKGYIKQSNLFTCQFTWYGKTKAIGGSFVGTSPEFDFAIYSLTFLSRVKQPVFHFGSDSVKVKCFGMAGGKLGTCYPILL